MWEQVVMKIGWEACPAMVWGAVWPCHGEILLFGLILKTLLPRQLILFNIWNEINNDYDYDDDDNDDDNDDDDDTYIFWIWLLYRQKIKLMFKITIILEASAKLYLTITKIFGNLREWQSKLKEKHIRWWLGATPLTEADSPPLPSQWQGRPRGSNSASLSRTHSTAKILQI